ncbi:MAG TPA: DUF5668 domain-containing protein, partial [Ignavibacteriaceae bacterium]|nr:DUF5668 domain-containing protein [Ignavibacteriaceae bacterium]
MKTKHLFWGFLFITLGILILINNFTSINFYWFNLWQFWPVFIILLGISLLIRNEIARGILISITAIILAISIFYVLQTGWGFFHDDVMVDFNNGIHIKDNEDAKYETTFFDEDFSDSLKQATFYFKSGAGSFKIKDTTDKLFSAVVTGYDNNYNITRLDEGEITKLHFENDRDSHF